MGPDRVRGGQMSVRRDQMRSDEVRRGQMGSDGDRWGQRGPDERQRGVRRGSDTRNSTRLAGAGTETLPKLRSI